MSGLWSEEAGAADAPLVALIHGTMDRSTGMVKLSRRLDDRFRVLRYDRRGYGRSVPREGGSAGPFDMATQVDDLVGLLDGRRVLLIGHSYGGNVALATASRHPALVVGVAVYEAPLSWEEWWPGSTAGSQARAMAGQPAEAAERFMRRMIGDAAWHALPERTRSTRRAEGPALVGELGDLQDNPPWRAEAIRCPVTLSYGSRGAAHHREGMEFVHAGLPGSELIVLDGCRHDAPLRHAALFASAIVESLARSVGDPWALAVTRSAVAP